jgi:hypothetical protein
MRWWCCRYEHRDGLDAGLEFLPWYEQDLAAAGVLEWKITFQCSSPAGGSAKVPPLLIFPCLRAADGMRFMRSVCVLSCVCCCVVSVDCNVHARACAQNVWVETVEGRVGGVALLREVLLQEIFDFVPPPADWYVPLGGVCAIRQRAQLIRPWLLHGFFAPRRLGDAHPVFVASV